MGETRKLKKNLDTPLTRMDVALILKDLGLPSDLLDFEFRFERK